MLKCHLCARELQKEFIYISIITYKRFSNCDGKENLLVEKGGVILLHAKDMTRARSQGTKVRQPRPDFFKYALNQYKE